MSENGETWGMISGGCLEHDVMHHAKAVMESGATKILRYDSTSEEDIVFGTGLGCNGIIDVMVEPVTEVMRNGFISAVEACLQTRQPAALASLVDGPAQCFSDGANHAFMSHEIWHGSSALIPLLSDLALDESSPILLSGILAGAEARLFIQPVLPPIQLVIFGGWLDAIPLIRISKEIGFQTVLVDSRRRESSRQLYRDADNVLLCSPNEALERIHFDSRTMAVLMNHSFERDQEALLALTKVAPPFLGMLGTKDRQQRILAALSKEGVIIADRFASNIHGPVGLDIGAKTPEEIALSIVAEILAVLNQRSAKPIRDRVAAPAAAPAHEPQPELAYA